MSNFCRVYACPFPTYADATKAKHLNDATMEYLDAAKQAAMAAGLPAGVASDGSICTAPAGANVTFDELPTFNGSHKDASMASVRNRPVTASPLPALSLASVGDTWDIKDGSRLASARAPATQSISMAGSIHAERPVRAE